MTAYRFHDELKRTNKIDASKPCLTCKAANIELYVTDTGRKVCRLKPACPRGSVR